TSGGFLKKRHPQRSVEIRKIQWPPVTVGKKWTLRMAKQHQHQRPLPQVLPLLMRT
ncbi:unnamed protein product, partial [Amoebophrya sp. A25]